MGRSIDLNSDTGESFGAWSLGDDTAMLAVVSSASIACGFHAGDPLTMLACCRTAAENGVAVGAHVAYRDLAGFGRRAMDVPPGELYGDVLYQLAALAGIAASAGVSVGYVKPHGALYNRIVTDAVQASAVADAVRDFGGGLSVLGLAGSAIEAAAHARGMPFVSEAFVDRGYRADGSLVPRSQPGAVLGGAAQGGVAEVARRAVAMVTDGTVVADDGATIPIAVESLCVHGDTAGAVAMARAVRAGLEEAGIRIEAFV
ncbi:LamB/YcsF family protein [Rathayibacter soli]|uniref:LamB/YcsF family protein n=1 Tax=Rathayibacter soli TaxID=3144168 RepID=UPI0027E5B684|nr:5-oxoprolinase subunit PxpA [Glaciibacter superstes]